MNVTAQLVENVLEHWNKIPDATLDKAGELILDGLGVAIAGSKTAEGKIVTKYVKELGGNGRCTVIGSSEPIDPARAAFANGTMGYSIGLTDTHSLSITHPGASVIPAAIAVAEQEGCSGVQLLKAITLGYEVVTRIGSAVNPSHRARGFHPTATCNPFGTATASALLLGCNKEQLAWALGIVGSTAGGLYEFRLNGDMTMAFHGGWPAQSGIMAAYMAKNGFTGPKTILEGQDGFLRAMTDRYDSSAINHNFGKIFSVDQMSIRPYCACRYAHPAIEAIEIIKRRTHGINISEIKEVIIDIHKTAIDQETEPNNLVSARLCTAFNVALALLYGPKLTEISQDDLHDKKIQGIYKKIKLVEEPKFTAQFPKLWTAKVQIIFKDGNIEEETVDHPKGDPTNPMTQEDLANKFRYLTSPLVATERSEQIINIIRRIKTLHDVSELTRQLKDIQ